MVDAFEASLVKYVVARASSRLNSINIYQCHPSLTQSTRSLLTFRFARQ